VRKLFKYLGILAGIVAVAAAAFYFTFLHGLPKPKVAFQPIKFSGSEMPGQHSCLWMGPVTIDSFNTAFPDEGAIYWPTVFEYPVDEDAGSYLEISGIFPKARYMSIHTYTEGAVPYDRFKDNDIKADAGFENPFTTGIWKPGQKYTLKVLLGTRPDNAAPNTLYFGPVEKISSTPLIVRNYVPEVEGDPSGGAGLPKVALVRANGERVEGEKLCALLKIPPIGDPKRIITTPAIPGDVYAQMMSHPGVRQDVFEAEHKDWTLFWGPKLSVMRLMSPELSAMFRWAARKGIVKKETGLYQTVDNDYVSMYVNDKYGKVIVLEAKLPRIPATGAESANADKYDLRYWSLCTNEGLASTRYTDCVYDKNVVTDKDRNYTIVISKPDDRPANATRKCGVTWLDFGQQGDGAGNTGLSTLIMRNMLANPDFPQAIQRIPTVGEERATLGVYLPTPQYSNKATFEKQGCNKG
jgi:hypothetical protein